MIGKIIGKMLRELYRAFHPKLWNKGLQINGIPHIYDIKKLKMGDNVSINSGCVLQCYGGITIEDNVTISDGAKILTRGLDVSDYISNSENEEREHIDRGVKIGKGTWIATNVVILPGVNIAAKCIIAAGAVVSRDIKEEACIYGGIPAHLIKKLN